MYTPLPQLAALKRVFGNTGTKEKREIRIVVTSLNVFRFCLGHNSCILTHCQEKEQQELLTLCMLSLLELPPPTPTPPTPSKLHDVYMWNYQSSFLRYLQQEIWALVNRNPTPPNSSWFIWYLEERHKNTDLYICWIFFLLWKIIISFSFLVILCMISYLRAPSVWTWFYNCSHLIVILF